MVLAMGTTAFAASIAAYLVENMPTGITADGTSTNSTIDNLDAGYYLVTCDGEEHALAELLTATDSVTIYDKNVIEFDKQQADANEEGTGAGDYGDDTFDVQIGDTVYYQITGKVPDTTGYSTYTYKITDTLSEGLTLNASSIVIKVGDTQVYPVTEGTSVWTVTTEPGKNDTWTFQASVDLLTAGYATNTDIVITYTATVNENAVAGVHENNAGSILPGTGGMGTTILYVIGILLIAGAVITLVVRRRMRSK